MIHYRKVGRSVNNDLVTTWKEEWAGHVARMGEKNKRIQVLGWKI